MKPFCAVGVKKYLNLRWHGFIINLPSPKKTVDTSFVIPISYYFFLITLTSLINIVALIIEGGWSI